MWRYVLRRLLILIPVLVLVSVIVFLIAHATPGDPIRTILGEEATPESVQELRTKLGLDQPLPVQYALWAQRAVTGDFGKSLRDGQPVTQAILERLPATIELGLAAVLFSLLIALPLGIISAVKRNTWADGFATFFSLLGVSIPNFVLGILLILFLSYYWRIFSPGGYVPVEEDLGENLKHLVLPAITLGAASAAVNTRQLRSAMLDVLSQDYIRTAHAKGLRSGLILTRHALRNALIPLVTVVGLQIGTVLEGAFVTETIFSWPGIGQLAVKSIGNRDYPVIQGVVLLSALIYMTINLLVDISYTLIDPRIKLSNA
ncbi:MAG TPA: nickel ABC transporter permease [Chloroflexia bacterium]|nr:nickel ABC transporter permease [Chloroflexia bacterium]